MGPGGVIDDLKRIYDRLAEYYQQRLEQTDCGDDIGEVADELAQLGYELGLDGHTKCDRCGAYMLPRETERGCGRCYDIGAGLDDFLRFVKWGPTGAPPPPPFCDHGVRREEHCSVCQRNVMLILDGIRKRPVM